MRRLRAAALGAVVPLAAVVAGGDPVKPPPSPPVLRASVHLAGLLPTGDRWLEIRVDDMTGRPAARWLPPGL